jgi:hypothetical protein
VKQGKNIAAVEAELAGVEDELRQAGRPIVWRGEGQPEEWSAVYDEAAGAWYYLNNYTGETRWA